MSGYQSAPRQFARFATANPYRGGLADIQFARCRADCCLRGWVCSGSLSPMARSGLGKGLGALIGTPSVAASTDVAESGERVHQINLASVVPSTLQPRKDFGREALQELIDSIRQHGIIQPLIVRLAAGSPSSAGQLGARFELIAG